MREVQRATAGASTSTAAADRSGGVLFVHCFGATLNAHVHLHLYMLDGVVAQGRQGLVFRRAEVDEACVERVQAAVRQRVLGLFERRGLLSSETVAVMQRWGHRCGFSVHAGERVAVQDSAGRVRLLRYRSLIRQWVGISALQKWHTRRSIGRRGPAACRVRRIFRDANAGLQKFCNFRLLNGRTSRNVR